MMLRTCHRPLWVGLFRASTSGRWLFVSLSVWTLFLSFFQCSSFLMSIGWVASESAHCFQLFDLDADYFIMAAGGWVRPCCSSCCCCCCCCFCCCCCCCCCVARRASFVCKWRTPEGSEEARKKSFYPVSISHPVNHFPPSIPPPLSLSPPSLSVLSFSLEIKSKYLKWIQWQEGRVIHQIFPQVGRNAK